MKPDYKNWVPKSMVIGVAAGAVLAGILFVLFGVFGIGVNGTLRLVLAILFGIAFLALCAFSTLCILWYRAFSYNGTRQLSRQIIEGIAAYVTLPEGGRGLDVGCGSGALTIASAKRNPKAVMTGLDRWGKEYASFNKPLCEHNAAAEGVANTLFMQGDATKLDFADESFDAVTSNYVYHNITGADKQALLRETLRVLKKGGVFAIHDIMSPVRYGDMKNFVKELKSQGYAEVRLIDTANGLFMSSKEAKLLALQGSALLVGKK